MSIRQLIFHDKYANELDFSLAEVDTSFSNARDYVNLTTTIVRELEQGMYQDDEAATLVIDNISDVFEKLESMALNAYEKNHLKENRTIADLNAVERTKWYAFRRKEARRFIDMIKALDKNIILTGRSKMEWDGTRPTNNRIFDGHEL